MKILLIEDNLSDILIIKKTLKLLNSNTNIDSIQDGEQALKTLKLLEQDENIENLPNIIILDLNLPKINGFEILQYIKHNNKLKHIPVIILTTSNYMGDINKAYKNYANTYICKPMSVKKFHKLLTLINNYWIKSDLDTIQIPKITLE